MESIGHPSPFRLVPLSHAYVRTRVREDDCVVDATAGNGHDSCLLAELVGPSGRVHAFDIQTEAIEASRKRLEAEGLLERVVLHQRSHAEMDAVLEQAPSLILFNLGYLPGGDHARCTEAEESLRAVALASRLLLPDGLLLVVAYPGHPEGLRETQALRTWLAAQPHSRRHFVIGAEDRSPELLMHAPGGLSAVPDRSN